MKTKHKAILEAAIDKVINQISTDENTIALPDSVYYVETLVDRMTEAAITVFDMSVEAQEFYKHETE